jgi:cell wall-associated NlpC family hydrolase
VLGQTSSPLGASDAAACAPASATGVPLAPGPRAALLQSGLAAAPASAPPAVKEIIAAGNQIAGKPYVYGGGHGLALSEIAPSYDCSSSVSHLLYGAGLVPVTYDGTSGTYMTWGQPGPGRWVTIYASYGHVFMYIAGLRWDTHNAAGPGDGSTGIGWHPLIRSAAGFVARHPAGL